MHKNVEKGWKLKRIVGKKFRFAHLILIYLNLHMMTSLIFSTFFSFLSFCPYVKIIAFVCVRFVRIRRQKGCIILLHKWIRLEIFFLITFAFNLKRMQKSFSRTLEVCYTGPICLNFMVLLMEKRWFVASFWDFADFWQRGGAKDDFI